MVERLVDIARQAGDEILKFYKKDFQIESKDNNTPLTEADLASHNVIFEGLQSLAPNIPIIS